MLSSRTLGHLSAISVFLDTAPGMRGGQPAEERLTAGTQLPQLVPALQEGEGRLRVAAAALSRARELRTGLTQIWTSAAGDEAATTDAVNDLLAQVGPLRLVAGEDAVGFAPATTPTDAVERLTTLAALALAEAAVEGELSRLRVCAGEDCENTLVDASRNRSKRFCDAANCANRTHVRSYRARLAESVARDDDAAQTPAEELASTSPGQAAENRPTADADAEAAEASGKTADKKADKAAKKAKKKDKKAKKAKKKGKKKDGKGGSED